MSRTSDGRRWWQVYSVALVAVVASIGALIFVDQNPQSMASSKGAESSQDSLDANSQTGDEKPDHSKFIENSTGSQISYLNLADGSRTGTATERFARPALSLGKLYIAQYVFENGSDQEKDQAIAMIASSSDPAANELYATYPESITEIADEYGLLSTRGADQWGYSVTSTYDVVKFIAALIREDRQSEVLEAMRDASETATDGYPQDWGTAVLPGVEGSKWGWSDDRQLHSSVSFGQDFVVAAAATGSKEDLTLLVENQMSEVMGD